MNFTQLGDLVLHFDHYLGAISDRYGALVYGVIFAIVFLEMAVLPLFFFRETLYSSSAARFALPAHCMPAY